MDGDKFYAWTNRVEDEMAKQLLRLVPITILTKLMTTSLFRFADPLCPMT